VDLYHGLKPLAWRCDEVSKVTEAASSRGLKKVQSNYRDAQQEVFSKRAAGLSPSWRL